MHSQVCIDNKLNSAKKILLLLLVITITTSDPKTSYQNILLVNFVYAQASSWLFSADTL